MPPRIAWPLTSVPEEFAIPSIAGAFALLIVILVGPVQARDLSLAQAESLVEVKNREVIASRRAAEAAQTQVVVAGARPNPTVSLSTQGYSPSSGIGAGPPQDKRLDNILRIDQTIERGGKRDLRIETAKKLEQAFAIDTLDTLRQQRAIASGAYFDLNLAQYRIAILRDQATLFARTFAAAQTRLKAGDIPQVDVAKVEVDYERARNDVQNAEAERARARVALAILIGEESRASELTAVDPWPEMTGRELPPIDAIVELRADVAAARARLSATEPARKLAKALRTRDVSIGTQVERYPGGLPVTTFGVGISFPIFAFYDYAGEIQAAETARYAALDALEKVRALASAEIQRTRADIQAAEERIARYQQTLLPAAERISDAAEFAFQRGASSVIEVLDAQRTVRAVRLEALAARADFARALVAFRSAHATLTMDLSADRADR